jgi:hypothetical protein
MDESLRASAEAACLRLTQAIFVLSDRGEYAAYANLFTETGRFCRPGLDVSGRHAILEAIQKRSDHVVMRHVGISAVVDMIDDNRAGGRGSHVFFMHDKNTGISAPPVVADFMDEYERTPAGWRIAARVVTTAFPQ